jgi:hypothetical protein
MSKKSRKEEKEKKVTIGYLLSYPLYKKDFKIILIS